MELVDNVYVRTFAAAVDAARAAMLPYEEARFHAGYRPTGERLPLPGELLKIFPGLKGDMLRRRRRVRERLAAAEEKAEAELRAMLSEINRAGCDKDLLTHVAKRTYHDRVALHEKELRRVERFTYEGKGGITDSDIARAREHPIANVIEVSRRDGFVKCPFHEERTASLKVFKDNHWWCFGACQDGGDVISLVMKMDGCRFVDAVRKLSGK